MTPRTDPYLSRPVRMSRWTAMIVTWVIWLTSLVAACVQWIPQMVLLLLMLCGFAPYMLSIHVVEPWLMRRSRATSRPSAFR
jgi:hypothetical protein